MSDPILDIESTTEDCERVELITIAHGTTTYRLTTGTRDIEHEGDVYTVVAGARGEIGVAQSGEGKDMTLTLPINHALVKRYLQMATPPQRITVTLRRKYLPSGLSEIKWIGDVADMKCDDQNTEATFRIPSRMAEQLLRPVPARTVGRLCPYTLYDTRCKVDPTASVGGVAHKVTATVLLVDGRDVKVNLASTGRNGTWSEFGKVRHVLSGEQVSVQKQTDVAPGVNGIATLSLSRPIPGMKAGDSIEVFAGCNWGQVHCHEKFDNKDNYGGLPQLPTKNPHTVAGIGP